MPDVQIVDLYHQVHGDPQPGSVPLLLLPGGGVTIELNWGSILPYLSEDRQVIAVEMQGHGRTPNAERPYTFENSAEDVAALIERLDLGQVDVLGFSNGGNVALRLAMRYPELVRRQIVASVFYQRAGMQEGFWDGIENAQIESFPEPYREADQELNPDPAHQQQVFDLDMAQMRGFTDWSEEDLQGLSVPTLFVAGDRDVVQPGHLAEMAGLVEGARLMILPASHGDFLGEALASSGDLTTMKMTLPWLLRFLDDEPGEDGEDGGSGE